MYKVVISCLVCLCIAAGCSTHKKNVGKVRIGYLNKDLHELAVGVALKKNFFKDEGVEIETIKKFTSGVEEMKAFSAKEIDMGYVGEAPATAAGINATADIQVVAQVNLEGSSIVVRKDDAGITDVKSLKGKTIAMPALSTVQDTLLRKAFQKNGILEKDATIVVMKPTEMIDALTKKKIDAFIAWESFPANAVLSGSGRILISSRDIWGNHPCCVFVADKSFLTTYPERVEAMVRAHIKATDFINKNPEEAIKIAAEFFEVDQKVVREAMKSIKYSYMISVDGEKEYVTFLKDNGYVKDLNVDTFIKNFLNVSIIDKVK